MSIIERGDDWVVVNKPPGMLAHPTRPGGPITLWDELCGYFGFEIANGGQLAVINRLDRDTSGAVLAATTNAAARRLTIAMQHRQINKEYLALVRGWPEWTHCECAEPLLRRASIDPQSPTWVEQIVHPDGAAAHTQFQVEQKLTWHGRQISLFRCFPLTGRMHQIRVHLAHLGHPVLGDKLYFTGPQAYVKFIDTGWNDELAEQLWLPRQALHSEVISFPAGNTMKSTAVRVSFANDLKQVLEESKTEA